MAPPAMASARADWSPQADAPPGAAVKVKLNNAELTLNGTPGDCSPLAADGSYVCETAAWQATWYLLPAGWSNSLTATPVTPNNYTATASRPNIATKPTEWLVNMAPPVAASARVFWDPAEPPANGTITLTVTATDPLDPNQTRDAALELDGRPGNWKLRCGGITWPVCLRNRRMAGRMVCVSLCLGKDDHVDRLSRSIHSLNDQYFFAEPPISMGRNSDRKETIDCRRNQQR